MVLGMGLREAKAYYVKLCGIMADEIFDVIIRGILTGVGGLIATYLTFRILSKSGIKKTDKKTNEIIIESVQFKGIFKIALGAGIFLCALPLLFINQFDKSDYFIYAMFILFWVVLLFPSALYIWGKKINYSGNEIRVTCLWKRNFIEGIENIDTLINIPTKYLLIKFNSGNKVKIPNDYTSSSHLYMDLYNKIPRYKIIEKNIPQR